MKTALDTQIEVAGSWHEAHMVAATLEPPPAGYFWAVTTKHDDNSPKIIYLARFED